jgi:autophagy-related protein 101
MTRQVTKTRLACTQLWVYDSSNDPHFCSGYTYVRAQSPDLDRTLRQELAAFSNDLRRNSGGASGSYRAGSAGQVSLEFYQKRKRWPFQHEEIPWEVWTVRCDLVHLGNEHERLRWQEKVGEMLSDKVCCISNIYSHSIKNAKT